MSKVLFFFTAQFPYAKGESFIENELPFLESEFDKIVIVTNELSIENKRLISSNIRLERFPYELSGKKKIFSIFGVFNLKFWKEIVCIKKTYKKGLNSIIIKTALASLCKTNVFRKDIFSLIQKHSNTHDQMYAYSYWSNDILFVLTTLRNKIPQLKIFSRAHGWDVYFEANKANYLPFREYIFKHTDKVFFISNKGLNYYTSIFPDYKNKMDVSRLGVPNQNVLRFNRKRNIKLVSCSNIIPLKRVHLIVEALSSIDSLEIEWIHFGDGILFLELELMCDTFLKNKKNITYNLKGSVFNKSIIEYYSENQIDLLINVSSSEGIPVSIMEAMSFGIPVIATNVGGTSEIVQDGYNGVLMSPNPNAEDIAKTLINFSNLSEKEVTQLRTNAYETWNTKFNADKNYQDFIDKIFAL